MSGDKKAALFVCLGNICRSPIAEAVFLEAVRKRGLAQEWAVDSAAIGPWHKGKKPELRAQRTMLKHDLYYDNTARQIRADDYLKFDYIFGMDDENIADLENGAPSGEYKAKILLLGESDPQGERIIRDPYYDSGSEGFEKCLEQCVRSVDGFLDDLYKK